MLLKPAEMPTEEAKNLFKVQRNKVIRGINLIDGVKIRLASKEDLEDLNTICLDRLGPTRKYSAQTFVLVKYLKGKTDFKFELVMKNTVLALRLLKGGYVSAGHIFHILLPEKHSLALTSLGERPKRRIGLEYVLDFEEIPTLRKILRRLQTVDFTKRKSFALSCKRFQRGYEEEDLEDRLIDFMIALEALFLRGEKGGLSSGRIIAVACSTLLGKTDEEREQIRQLLSEAYEMRNYIVHGAEYKKKSDDVYYIPELVSKVEDYLRESIKKLLD